MTGRKQLDVYVRLGDGEQGRDISFRIPDDIPQKELLDAGFAIDGNSALLGVSAFTDQDSGQFVTLGEAHRDEQRQLVGFFETKGYDVKFK